MWGEIAGVLSAVSAAAGSLLVRALGQNVHPFLMNALRCFLAALGFAVIWAVGVREAGDWQAALPLLLFAVTAGLVIGDSMYFSAIVRIGPARATPIAMSYPIPTAIIAFLLLDESLSLQKLAGIMIGVAAIWIVATPGRLQFRGLSFDRAYLTGVGLAGAASLLWAVSIIALRPALSLVPTEFANLARMAMAFALLAVVSWRVVENPLQVFGLRRSLALVAGLGVTAVLTTYFLAESVHHSGASVAALMSSMTPVFAAPIAWFLFHDVVNARLLGGIALGLLGMALVAFAP